MRLLEEWAGINRPDNARKAANVVLDSCSKDAEGIFLAVVVPRHCRRQVLERAANSARLAFPEVKLKAIGVGPWKTIDALFSSLGLVFIRARDGCLCRSACEDAIACGCQVEGGRRLSLGTRTVSLQGERRGSLGDRAHSFGPSPAACFMKDEGGQGKEE